MLVGNYQVFPIFYHKVIRNFFKALASCFLQLLAQIVKEVLNELSVFAVWIIQHGLCHILLCGIWFLPKAILFPSLPFQRLSQD